MDLTSTETVRLIMALGPKTWRVHRLTQSGFPRLAGTFRSMRLRKVYWMKLDRQAEAGHVSSFHNAGYESVTNDYFKRAFYSLYCNGRE